MATHFGVLAWTIPGTGEPGGLPSMGSHRVSHDWSDLETAAAADLPFTKFQESELLWLHVDYTLYLAFFSPTLSCSILHFRKVIGPITSGTPHLIAELSDASCSHFETLREKYTRPSWGYKTSLYCLERRAQFLRHGPAGFPFHPEKIIKLLFSISSKLSSYAHLASVGRQPRLW